MVISKNVVSREIPGFKGYLANDDGSITKPRGKTTFGTLRTDGYFQICINYNVCLVHRLIAFAWVENPRPDIFKCVDHKNINTRGDKNVNTRGDNRPGNLRWLSDNLNKLNSSGKNCGFHKASNKWRAYYTFNKKMFHIGCFDTEAEAHRVGRAGRDACFEKEYKRLCAGGNP